MALFKGQHSEKCEKESVCKITNNSYAFHTLFPAILKKNSRSSYHVKKNTGPHTCIELHVLCYIILQRSWHNND